MKTFFQRSDSWNWISVQDQYIRSFYSILLVSILSATLLTMLITLSVPLAGAMCASFILCSFTFVSIARHSFPEVGITLLSGLPIALCIIVEMLQHIPLTYAV